MDKPPTTVSQRLELFDCLLKLFQKSIYLIGIIAVLFWSFFNQEIFTEWLNSLTKAEAFGVKLERDIIVRTERELEILLRETENPEEYSNAAITRAVHSYAAIKNANVLWVTDRPNIQSNTEIVKILRQISINVTVLTTTAGAMEYINANPVELVVTDIWFGRKDVGRTPIKKCHVFYSDFPGGYKKGPNETLDEFNKKQNFSAPGGYYLAELIERKFGIKDSKPKLIFYSAENARISRSFCGNGIYNRYDFLLQAIISQLEEKRWRELIKEKT
jgi:hypothetical protein